MQAFAGIFFFAAFICSIIAFWFPIVSLSIMMGSLALVSLMALADIQMSNPVKEIKDQAGKGPLSIGTWLFLHIPLLGGTAMSLWYLILCLKYNDDIVNDEMPTNWKLYHKILCTLFIFHIALLALIEQRTASFRLITSLAYVTTAWLIVFVIFQNCMGTMFKTCG